MGKQILEILLSQWAIIGYEIVILVVLIFFIVRLMKQRKRERQQKMNLVEQNKWQSFEESLQNEKRR